MIDLGNIRYHQMCYPIHDMVSHLRYYEQLSGRPIDLRSLHYHTLMATLYGRLANTERLGCPDPWAKDQVAIQCYEAIGRRGILELLMDVCGIEAEPPELPASANTIGQKYYELLVGLVDGPVRRQLSDSTDSAFWLDCTLSMARMVARHGQFARQFEDEDIRGLTGLLGKRPASVRAGLGALEQLIRDDPRPRLQALLVFLHQYQCRQNYLHEPIQQAMGFATDIPLPRLGAIPLL
jgi:hypothetical protein